MSNVLNKLSQEELVEFIKNNKLTEEQCVYISDYIKKSKNLMDGMKIFSACATSQHNMVAIHPYIKDWISISAVESFFLQAIKT